MIQIYLVDDHQMFRKGIESLLEDEKNFSLVGSAPDVNTFLQERPEAKLLLLDLSLEDGLSLTALSQIYHEYPDLKIIILTMHDKPMMIKKALEAGVSGYVIKHSSPGVLIEAIRCCSDGGKYLDPALSESLIMLICGGQTGVDEREKGYHSLSRREQEVFNLTIEGLKNEQIARKLGISRKTVENHRFRLMQKLEVGSAGELTELAREMGIL